MTEFNVEAIFERMREACKVKNDFQLGKYLAVTPSTVKGWKDAKQPPFKACFEIYDRTGVTVEWLLTGKVPGQVLEITPSVDPANGFHPLPDEGLFVQKYLQSIELGLLSGFIALKPDTTQDEVSIMAQQLYTMLNANGLIPAGKANSGKADSGKAHSGKRSTQTGNTSAKTASGLVGTRMTAADLNGDNPEAVNQ